MDPGVVERARRIGEDVLFPAALAVDRAEVVPAGHLDVLAAAGLFGLVGPAEAGGLAGDVRGLGTVVEVLAEACLATTFVWIQHHGAVRALAAPGAPAALREAWLAPLCRGERRAGLALTGLLPGPPRLRATPSDGDGDPDPGWVLTGESPWVTGWGLVDALLVAARGHGDTVVWLLVDAADGPGVRVERQRLVAADASVTVRLAFDGVAVPADRLIRVEPYHEAAWVGARQLRVNGSLALGVASRCCRILGPGPLDGELDACRALLDESGDDGMPAARAAASELALRAAAAAAVHEGSRSVLVGDHGQRLVREALFLLVFGTRPSIRAELLQRLRAVPDR